MLYCNILFLLHIYHFHIGVYCCKNGNSMAIQQQIYIYNAYKLQLIWYILYIKKNPDRFTIGTNTYNIPILLVSLLMIITFHEWAHKCNQYYNRFSFVIIIDQFIQKVHSILVFQPEMKKILLIFLICALKSIQCDGKLWIFEQK